MNSAIMILRSSILSLLGLLALMPVLRAEEPPSPEEMWRIIQAQQQQIQELMALVESNRSDVAAAQSEVASARTEAAGAKAEAASARSEVSAARSQLEATTLAVEEIANDAGSASSGWWERTSLGGYGELHATFPEASDNEIDLHRFVLFVNHEFNDWITLYSELEWEHAIVADTDDGSSPGEVTVEQAFIRMDFTDQFSLDTGVILMPVGIVNEMHEPTTFYGVERSRIESNIIPTTWREGGVRGIYRFDNGLSLEGGIFSGLDIDPAEGRIRSGRLKVGEAINNEAAFAGRVRYTGIAGLELAASAVYQDDLAQSSAEEVSGLLSSVHADYRKGGFGFRALYARWDLDGETGGALPATAETQKGFYLEPSYRWSLSEHYGDLGVYFRYSDYEFQRRAADFYENRIYEIGVSYWPTEDVVFKLDIQDTSDAEEFPEDDYITNLGLGFHF